jgi:membrane associated rhomboid family serine protease
MRNKTVGSPRTERWFWPAWGAAFLGFPIGGAAATLLVGPIESVGAALIAGGVAGGVIGAAQWLVLRRRLPLSALWVPATAGGMALGMALGQVLLGSTSAKVSEVARGVGG